MPGYDDISMNEKLESVKKIVLQKIPQLESYGTKINFMPLGDGITQGSVDAEISNDIAISVPYFIKEDNILPIDMIAINGKLGPLTQNIIDRLFALNFADVIPGKQDKLKNMQIVDPYGVFSQNSVGVPTNNVFGKFGSAEPIGPRFVYLEKVGTEVLAYDDLINKTGQLLSMAPAGTGTRYASLSDVYGSDLLAGFNPGMNRFMNVMRPLKVISIKSSFVPGDVGPEDIQHLGDYETSAFISAGKAATQETFAIYRKFGTSSYIMVNKNHFFSTDQELGKQIPVFKKTRELHDSDSIYNVGFKESVYLLDKKDQSLFGPLELTGVKEYASKAGGIDGEGVSKEFVFKGDMGIVWKVRLSASFKKEVIVDSANRLIIAHLDILDCIKLTGKRSVKPVGYAAPDSEETRNYTVVRDIDGFIIDGQRVENPREVMVKLLNDGFPQSNIQSMLSDMNRMSGGEKWTIPVTEMPEVKTVEKIASTKVASISKQTKSELQKIATELVTLKELGKQADIGMEENFLDPETLMQDIDTDGMARIIKDLVDRLCKFLIHRRLYGTDTSVNNRIEKSIKNLSDIRELIINEAGRV